MTKKSSSPSGRPIIQPVGDRVLIEYAADKEQIRGGVIIPDSARERPQEATVIALGTGRKDKHGVVIPFEVRVGDAVLVAKYGGAEVKLDGRTFTLVREDEILGVLS